MTYNNEFLQRVYEANPDGWMPQGWKPVTRHWADTATPSWHCSVDWRLRPVLREGLTEPPEEAYLYEPDRGGIYVPDVLCVSTGFAGWCLQSGTKKWLYGDDWNGGSPHYILDVSDPNSRAILEANGLWPGDGERLMKIIYVRSAEIDPNDPDVYQGMVEAGWTPPDAKPVDTPSYEEGFEEGMKVASSDWVTLDGAEFQIRSEGRWKHESRLHAMGYSLSHGPDAVRVRKD